MGLQAQLTCSCGAPLPAQKTGRPKQRCLGCLRQHRKKYKAEIYQKTKAEKNTRLEIIDLESEIQETRQQLAKFIRWKSHEVNKQENKGLYVIFQDDWTLKQKERVCYPIRKAALRALAEKEKRSRG